MRLSKFTWFLVAVITIIYTAIFIVIRVQNPHHIQATSYQQWRKTYVIKQSANRAFVNTSNQRSKPVALSEGQGYGLYITAAAGKHGWASSRDFDQLLNYYLAHRDRVGETHQTLTYLMKWRQYQKKGHWVSDINSATDGDLFIAMALHQAAQIWPKRAAYYRNLEHHLTNDILAYEYNPQTKALTVGDWATSKSKYYRLMRTSDVAPTFFDAFYHSSHDPRWRTVKNGMLDRLADLSAQHQTGLVPDFAWITADSAKPVKPWTVASENDGNYSANACRVPMMLAASKDPRAQKTLSRMMRFFSHRTHVTAGYTLTGQQLNHYQSASFSAPIFEAVSFNRNHGYDNLFSSQKFVFSKPLPKDNYYDATLTTIAAMEGMN